MDAAAELRLPTWRDLVGVVLPKEGRGTRVSQGSRELQGDNKWDLRVTHKKRSISCRLGFITDKRVVNAVLKSTDPPIALLTAQTCTVSAFKIHQNQSMPVACPWPD